MQNALGNDTIPRMPMKRISYPNKARGFMYATDKDGNAFTLDNTGKDNVCQWEKLFLKLFNVQVTNITGILYREQNYRDYGQSKSTRLSRAADKGYMVVAINNVVQGGMQNSENIRISYSLRWSLIELSF
ncbi:hypothetical protein TNCT_311231 [Trichonephila clavata]|uniref:Uncharacterized protein n=1 Tax=Trichonephila clavata TaxID=2740835 RepID=A0A8X6IWX3_TRICU|nr:hypothetical protein TNCT_311231 [Trichonephila clavata]